MPKKGSDKKAAAAEKEMEIEEQYSDPEPEEFPEDDADIRLGKTNHISTFLISDDTHTQQIEYQIIKPFCISQS